MSESEAIEFEEFPSQLPRETTRKPKGKQPKKDAAVKQAKKVKEGKEIATKQPEWYDLHWVLSETADHLTRGLLKRTDLPPDVLDILRGILVLRESKDLFFAEGKSITAFSAMFWAEELKKWADNPNAP
jgi:hypothetical protein